MTERAVLVRNRLFEIITKRHGRVEENLITSGILDSLRAVELAIALEQEFRLEADSFALSDMATVTALTERILKARNDE